MTENSNGWLNNYILFFKNFSQTEDFATLIKKINAIDNPEHFIYSSVQPTGLMYGYPIRFSENNLPETLEVEEHEKTKMILIDCLINCSLFLKTQGVDNEEDMEEVLRHIIGNIADFYNQVYANQKSISQADDISKEVENLIDKRVAGTKKWNQNFWTSYFQNSLLFLDIIYFSRWLQHGDMERFNTEKEDIYFLIIKIIAASANANSQIEKEEEMLFKNFLDSTKMKEEKVKMANDYFFKGISLDSIDFTEIDSWIIKKYLLEIAILIIWSDRLLEDSEKGFLVLLTAKLGFTELELDESLLAIEGFVLSNWEKIPYKNNSDFDTVNESLVNRMNVAIGNRLKLAGLKFPKSDEFDAIIKKSLVATLSDEENKILKGYLLELIKEIPSLAIFLLPGGSILLPQLLKSLSNSTEIL
ncbi:MAG: hypothetical protein ACKVOU_08555 [Cytophagales bacterium]